MVISLPLYGGVYEPLVYLIMWCLFTKRSCDVLFLDSTSQYQPFHVHIQASTPNEIRPQVILDKVGGASGSKSNVK